MKWQEVLLVLCVTVNQSAKLKHVVLWMPEEVKNTSQMLPFRGLRQPRTEHGMRASAETRQCSRVSFSPVVGRFVHNVLALGAARDRPFGSKLERVTLELNK